MFCKRRNRILNVLTLALIFTFMFSMVAFADDAVMDILDQPRFGGAVQWVNRIGKIVDNWFMAVISFVSFFIISASCLRNVLAGAYCVFPKFWDGVHDAHQMTNELSISSAMSGMKGATSWTAGSITKFLMGLLPDIKVLTDFENAEKDSIDYKQYFMKAIPQCVVAVFVGVFIYNGLYRDVMSVTSRFGVTVASHAMQSIKPDAILEQMTNITVNIDYPTKGADYGTDLIANTWFEDVVGHGLGNGGYDDLYKKASKIDYYNKLDNWAINTFKPAFAPYVNTNQWKPSVDKRGSGIGSTPPANSNGGQAITEIDTGDEAKKTFLICVNMRSLGLQTTHTDQDAWIYGYITLEDQGYAEGKDGDTSVSDMTLVISLPGSTEGFPPEGVTFTAKESSLAHSGNFTYGGSSFTFSQNGNSITVKQADSGSIKFDEYLNTTSGGVSIGGWQVSRLRFIRGSGASVQAQMQCMFDNGTPKVTGSVGEDLGAKIRQAKIEKSGSQSGAGNGSGGDGNSDTGEDDEDSGLEDAE